MGGKDYQSAETVFQTIFVSRNVALLAKGMDVKNEDCGSGES